jgi:hypothetical protein
MPEEARSDAARIIHRVCCLSGSPSFVADIRKELRQHGINPADAHLTTESIFNWLVSALSYQGVSDQVAHGYIERHGQITWRDLKAALAGKPGCPKLASYWHFHQCGYEKISQICNCPEHFQTCSLPVHPLRNGRLNQMAYGLFLFTRDVAGGDLVAWIDARLKSAEGVPGPVQYARARDALIGPLSNIYGVADKALMMALSVLLIGIGARRRLWIEAGAHMIAVDTLVHNFLHRTGILRKFQATHAYGADCYRAGACADILAEVAVSIDARQFNPGFPQVFPRFVQHAIWRYCAQRGLGICNGNGIDDSKRCANVYCQIYPTCSRIALHLDRKRNDLQALIGC